MKDQIKPIMTRYKGYRFRSRLEARWAVFLDELGVPWEYEKEGYQLPDGSHYLPDFWLPREDIYLEIKGRQASHAEQRKAAHLARGHQKDVVVATGQPGECLIEVYSPFLEIPPEQWKAMTSLELPSGVWFSFEPYVRRPIFGTTVHWQIAEWITSGVAFDYDEELDRLALWHADPDVDHELTTDPWGRLREIEVPANWYNARFTSWAPPEALERREAVSLGEAIYGPTDIPLGERTKAAILAARSARFEFGENGPG